MARMFESFGRWQTGTRSIRAQHSEAGFLHQGKPHRNVHSMLTGIRQLESNGWPVRWAAWFANCIAPLRPEASGSLV